MRFKPQEVAWLRRAILAPDHRDPKALKGYDRSAVYCGKYPCPKCQSANTGTDTIATSERWMTFLCADCLHQFRKSAANTSSLSKSLRGLADVLNA